VVLYINTRWQLKNGFAQVFGARPTEAAGQGAGTIAEIWISTSNTRMVLNLDSLLPLISLR
jgi:hypothetical protein